MYYIGKTTEIALRTMHSLSKREREGKMLKSRIGNIV
jgi:hypothetical protein